jgi:hypothetical protein
LLQTYSCFKFNLKDGTKLKANFITREWCSWNTHLKHYIIISFKLINELISMKYSPHIIVCHSRPATYSCGNNSHSICMKPIISYC